MHKEPKDPAPFLVTLGPKLPVLGRKTISWLLRSLAGDQAMSRIVGAAHEKTTSELWQHRRDEYVAKAREYLWEDLGLDAIICMCVSLICQYSADSAGNGRHRTGSICCNTRSYKSLGPFGHSDDLLESRRLYRWSCSGSHRRSQH